jgi:hypothetical protein
MRALLALAAAANGSAILADIHRQASQHLIGSGLTLQAPHSSSESVHPMSRLCRFTGISSLLGELSTERSDESVARALHLFQRCSEALCLLLRLCAAQIVQFVQFAAKAAGVGITHG